MRTLSGWRAAAAVLGIGIAAAAGAEPAGRPAATDAPPAASAPSADRLSPEAARLYAAVRTPRPDELRWQEIPWLVDLQEGMRVAREENRPLLLFVSGDDPLEKC